MDIKIFTTYVLPSGLAAGLFSFIGNVIITLFQSYKENKMGEKRHGESLDEFRYKKIYENRNKLSEMDLNEGSIEPNEGKNNVIELSNNLNKSVETIYKNVLPLLDKDIASNLEKEFDELNQLTIKALEYTLKINEEKVGFETVIVSRLTFKENLNLAMEKQLKLLLYK